MFKRLKPSKHPITNHHPTSPSHHESVAWQSYVLEYFLLLLHHMYCTVPHMVTMLDTFYSLYQPNDCWIILGSCSEGVVLCCEVVVVYLCSFCSIKILLPGDFLIGSKIHVYIDAQIHLPAEVYSSCSKPFLFLIKLHLVISFLFCYPQLCKCLGPYTYFQEWDQGRNELFI